MKKVIVTVVALTMCTVFGVFGVSGADVLSLTVNGNPENKYTVKWNEKNDRLLVDADFVTECFDAEVQVQGKNIDVLKNGHKLHFETDNEFYVMDDMGGRKIGALAAVENEKAYLPLRYICEAFGAFVDYDNVSGVANVQTDKIVMSNDIKPYFENVQVYDQSTIRITGEKTVYIDPRRVLGEPHDADIILITHTHTDHYEIESIKRVMNENTVVYITADGVEQAKTDGLVNVVGVMPNQSYEEQGIKFDTVAAYNTATERQNHKQEYSWVGYIITINGYTYYLAGDTDFTDEMKNITKEIDVAFLPIDGKYNMPADEAAMAANTINPKVAIPYHYNNFVSENKTAEFASLLNDNIKSTALTFKMQ